MEDQGGQDKRAHPRFLFSEPVTYALPEMTSGGAVAGDISLGGMSLKVQEFIPVGAMIELQVRLGETPRVVCLKAQVVRVREVMAEDCFEIGLKFYKDEESEKAIAEFINKNKPRS